MSGQIKLTLRPPPNVDFVHGYPGIPPATPDRPQAAVKGAIEVRVGPNGVKAQWVQVALRKVETLPGGGQGNTFYAVVGPSPLYLWKASEEYAMLHAQDFPFYIRIPEAIPPTISLDRGAGIKYELVATVCTKGKRGLFRQRKEVQQTTSATVIVDKHELHSTWPVYCQPESRRHSLEGVMLTVDRNQSCFGPGDRVAVMATLKSDTLNTVILRGFEFVLKEVTVFRPAHNTGKRVVPQAKTVVIGEQKVPVNATLYGGTQHKAELAVVIPATHTTTSLSSARHIDITYTINVKALMGTGSPLIMEIPVTVSNWPRSVSIEAIRRIGPAPSLSLTQPGSPSSGTIGLHPVPHTIPGSSTLAPGGVDPFSGGGRIPPLLDVGPATAPAAATEFGARANRPATSGGTSGTGPSGYGTQVRPATTSNTSYQSEFANRPGGVFPVGSESGGGFNSRRPQSAMGPQARLGITNVGDEDPAAISANRNRWFTAEQEKQRLFDASREQAERIQAAAAGNRSDALRNNVPIIAVPTPKAPSPTNAVPSGSNDPSQGSQWPTSDSEKVRLFQQAQQAVNRTTGYDTTTPASEYEDAQRRTQEDASRRTQGYEPADDEKARFAAAQSAVRRTQGFEPPAPVDDEKARFAAAQDAVRRTHGYDPTAPVVQASAAQSSSLQNSGPSATTSSLRPQQKISPADMYSQAINSMGKPPADDALTSAARTAASLRAARPQYPIPEDRVVGARRSTAPPKAAAPQYPSAEDEKAALRRYHEAKQAVDKTQNNLAYDGGASSSADPVAYDALYPSNTSGSRPATGSRNAADSSSSSSTQAPVPASSSSTSQQPTWMVEKEKLRRMYEAQDAAATAAASSSQPPPNVPPPAFDEPTAAASSSSAQPSWMTEKEKLRRMYDAQDAAARAPQQTPSYQASPPANHYAPSSYAGGNGAGSGAWTNGGAGGSSSQPPSRTGSAMAAPVARRAIPVPPSNPGGRSQPLSAAQEKALLRARFESDEQQANGNGYASSSSAGPPPDFSAGASSYAQAPPPLAPRPPPEYIQETREESAHIARLVENPVTTEDDGDYNSNGVYQAPPLPPKVPLA